MPPAVAIAGAAVVGAGATMVAGSKAAKAQKQAANAQVAEYRRQYDTSRQDMMPWLETGRGALAQLARLYGIAGTDGSPDGDRYGGFTATPGYQWRLDQGVQAVERSAAARGLLRSGAAAKAIQRYGEGLASSEYGAYADRLAQLAGIGQASAAQTSASGMAATSGIAQALGAAGNARASSYANTGSAINQGVNNVLTAYLMQRGGFFGGGK